VAASPPRASSPERKREKVYPEVRKAIRSRVEVPLPARKHITVVPRKPHLAVVKAADKAEQRPASQKVCKQFKAGRCRWGAECWDQHAEEAKEAKIRKHTR
jgi:hypothetical protein